MSKFYSFIRMPLSAMGLLVQTEDDLDCGRIDSKQYPNMKKIILVLLIPLILFTTACSNWKADIANLTDVVWYSDEVNITITISEDTVFDGHQIGIGEVVINDEIINVSFQWIGTGMGGVDILTNNYDSPFDERNLLILHGTLNRRITNGVELKISENNINNLELVILNYKSL